MKKAAELVFIPAPGIGHLVSTVEIAKRLVDRDDRLFITILIMKHSFDSKADTYAESLKASSLTDQRIHFIDLPDQHHHHHTNQDFKDKEGINPLRFLAQFIETQKPHVREILDSKSKSMSNSASQLAGLVIDMFCTTMIDVANEFGVPAYAFFTSSAASLALMLHLQTLRDQHKLDTTDLKDDSHSTHELALPSFVNPVPARVLPDEFLNKESVTVFLDEHGRILRETKGIMVNTFMELESYAIHHSFNSDAAAATTIPPVYPVGPILNLKGSDTDDGHQKSSNIMEWLGDQPQSSVVFLCFGSMGSFGEAQVLEIARALEQSGTRFLWSLRQHPPKGQFAFPKDHDNLKEVLPEGFLDRTAEIGKVIGWAPQVEILAHPAVGGFVSHCGWNSTLESLWFGVPIATWPLYAEQQFNAFELVKELKLAVEIKLDYRRGVIVENDNQIIVGAEEIERGIRQVMEADSETRKKVEEMTKRSRKALMDGGSSHSSLGRLIDDVIHNIGFEDNLLKK